MEVIVDSRAAKTKDIPISIIDDNTGSKIEPLVVFQKTLDRLGRASLGVTLAQKEVMIIVLPPVRRKG